MKVWVKGCFYERKSQLFVNINFITGLKIPNTTEVPLHWKTCRHSTKQYSSWYKSEAIAENILVSTRSACWAPSNFEN